MKKLCLILINVLALLPAGWCAYADKEDTNTNCIAEPVLAPDTAAAQKSGGDYPYYGGDYPFYGNVPEEMLPYRNIEPYYRYWLTRLNFNGPGRDYPTPPDLKTLRVGLLSPAPYGPEAVRGEMTKRGALMAFDEANAARKPGEL